MSYALRGVGGVEARIRSARPSELGVSAITVAELRFGAHKRRSKKLHQLIDRFLAPIQELPFDSGAADCYGRIVARLQAEGRPIGMADAMIGAHALSLGLTLVTHNLRHFRRMEGLDLDDWRSSL